MADIYVGGSERFNAGEDNCDWAVGPNWQPASRYAQSKVLASIYRIAYPTGVEGMDRAMPPLGNDAEYALCLGYGTFAVRELLAMIEPALLLGESDSIGVAVGFDSGDFMLLGKLGPDGLAKIS